MQVHVHNQRVDYTTLAKKTKIRKKLWKLTSLMGVLGKSVPTIFSRKIRVVVDTNIVAHQRKQHPQSIFRQQKSPDSLDFFTSTFQSRKLRSEMRGFEPPRRLPGLHP